MPPRRPHSDLCLISVFKQLTPNEQMKASRMSPRCMLLVRAANRRLKSLVIRTLDDPVVFDGSPNNFEFFNYSRHCMQLLKGSVPFFRYQLSSRFTKWNCLLLWDAMKEDAHDLSPSVIVEQIVYIFSAVTNLKFAAHGRSEEVEMITKLLQHPHWAAQLTELMLACEGDPVITNYLIEHPVTTALNGLSSLQLLSVLRFYNISFRELTILSQLKVIVVDCHYTDKDDSFLRAFKRQPTAVATNSSNVTAMSQLKQQHLHLHLWNGFRIFEIFKNMPCYILSDLLSLSELERSCIVDLFQISYNPKWHDKVLRLLPLFTSLVSLTLDFSVTTETPLESTVVPLFTALSKLKQLLYLNLGVYFEATGHSSAPSTAPSAPPPRPLSVQLSSVRALDLELFTTSHSQVRWLNLAHTLPNCEGIFLKGWSHCTACNVCLLDFTEDLADYVDNHRFEGGGGGGGVQQAVAINCLRTTLSELHPGVHPSKLLFGYGPNWFRNEMSLEQLQSSFKQQ